MKKERELRVKEKDVDEKRMKRKKKEDEMTEGRARMSKWGEGVKKRRGGREVEGLGGR